jgi:type I restriction enzyme, S subunit
MGLQAFFYNFALLADASNGVAKLRELILQLAVQGKLVPQDLNEEPARVLLDRIKANKAQLIKSKQIKKSDVLSTVRVDEISFDIPDSWQWVRLGDLAVSMTNGIYKPDTFYSESGVGCLRMYNINNGKINFKNLKRISIDENELTQYRLCEGDLLVNRVNSRELVGKAAVIEKLREDLIFESKNIRVRFTIKEGLPQFINILFRTHAVRAAFEGDAKQTTGQASINQPQVSNIPVPLPPLEEQKRIIAKVDELMRLCDELETRQQARRESRVRLNNATLAPLNNAASLAPEEFKQASVRLADNFAALYDSAETVGKLRLTILQLAVQGKLVPQDPHDEPADKLLAAITDQRKRRMQRERVKAQHPLPPLSPDEVPYELPHGWKWERLGNIGDTNIGLTYSPKDIAKTGVPVLRSSNIQKGKIDLSDLVRVAIDPKRSVLVEVGDLLICARNGSRALVGKVALIEQLTETTAFGAFMAVFRSSLNQYLYHFICSPMFRQMIDEVNTTTINQITQANLRSTITPVPPLAEQKRIVAKVNQLMALCDELETKLRQAEADSEKLMKAAVRHVIASINEPSQEEALSYIA